MAVLHKNYNPRIKYNSDYSIGHDVNKEYLSSLSKWLMNKIRKSSRPYHEKHTGAIDNGKPGKTISITETDISKMIVDGNGIDPISGNPLYFGPIQVMQNPTEAQRLGLMTAEEASRRPSADRIDSSVNEYSVDNVQITTMSSNYGKANFDNDLTSTSVNIEYKLAKVTINNCSASYLTSVLKGL